MPEARRSTPFLVVTLCVASLLLVTMACDRDDEALPPIVVVTPEPVRGVIAQTSFSDFPAGLWVAIEVPVSTRGQLDITVDWTFEETWMYVYLVAVDCGFVELTTDTCPFLIESETHRPKPRVLYSDILDPASYYLYLYNVPRDPATGVGSDLTESVSVQLGLTVGFEGQGGEEPPVQLGRPRLVPPPQTGNAVHQELP